MTSLFDNPFSPLFGGRPDYFPYLRQYQQKDSIQSENARPIEEWGV